MSHRIWSATDLYTALETLPLASITPLSVDQTQLIALFKEVVQGSCTASVSYGSHTDSMASFFAPWVEPSPLTDLRQAHLRRKTFEHLTALQVSAVAKPLFAQFSQDKVQENLLLKLLSQFTGATLLKHAYPDASDNMEEKLILFAARADFLKQIERYYTEKSGALPLLTVKDLFHISLVYGASNVASFLLDRQPDLKLETSIQTISYGRLVDVCEETRRPAFGDHDQTLRALFSSDAGKERLSFWKWSLKFLWSDRLAFRALMTSDRAKEERRALFFLPFKALRALINIPRYALLRLLILLGFRFA